MPYDNSGGTGSPISFKCQELRRTYYKDQGREARRHTVTLTGRTKPYPRRYGIMRGHRSTDTSREYRCACGHVGWSAHSDLERMERRTP